MQIKTIYFQVNLAAQTISNSIADALEFLMNDMKHPDFQHAAGTIEFIRIFDKAFDLCNSRNPWARGSKAPLREKNAEYWMFILNEAMEYTKTLKTEQGKYLYLTNNKTPFKGFCITITSLMGLFQDYVKEKNSPLQFLLTYKFSQDHIELFFCCVR